PMPGWACAAMVLLLMEAPRAPPSSREAVYSNLTVRARKRIVDWVLEFFVAVAWKRILYCLPGSTRARVRWVDWSLRALERSSAAPLKRSDCTESVSSVTPAQDIETLGMGPVVSAAPLKYFTMEAALFEEAMLPVPKSPPSDGPGR